MTQAITLDTRRVAEDLYKVLRAIDPARWRDDLEVVVRDQLGYIQSRLHELLTQAEADSPALRLLEERLREVLSIIEEAVPDHNIPIERMAAAWNDFRLRTLPAYDSLAAGLRLLDIHVPTLRPTNYTRNLFHMSNGIVAVVLCEHALSQRGMIWVALSLAVTAWTLESTRRMSAGWNRFLMGIFSKVAHPHEHHRVNSATWFVTALLVLALLQDKMIALLAVAILSFADPVAAIIGRRYGRMRLVNGRTLEGTVAFALMAGLIGLTYMAFYYPLIAVGPAVAMVVAASVAGALAELFSRRIDDNISIPLSVAAVVMLVRVLIGL